MSSSIRPEYLSEGDTIINVFIYLFNDLHFIGASLLEEQLFNFLCLVSWLIIMNIKHVVELKRDLKKVESKLIGNVKKDIFNNTPITETQQLKEYLKPYVERITTRIKDSNLNGERAHISLVGDFGTGKTSIINCVKNELKKVNLEFIHSNIDTWGTDIKSINSFVLAKVVDDVADYVDMSGFKSLPSQYIEALKLGNNAFKFLAIFSTLSSDPKKGLIKLDEVLGVINKKLLITIQDVDRNDEANKVINELAALLDKLKILNNINFIVALGNENGICEMVTKVCDYREFIRKPNDNSTFIEFISEKNEVAKNMGLIVSELSLMQLTLNVHTTKYSSPYEIISSERNLKKIKEQVDYLWSENLLMGEVGLELLCLFLALKEEYPFIFHLCVDNQYTLLDEIKTLEDGKEEKISDFLSQCAQHYPSDKNLNNLKSFLIYLSKCQDNLGQGMTHKQPYYPNYLKRIDSGVVPDSELKDQEVLHLFRNIGEAGKVEELIKNFKNDEKGNHWIEAYSRFSLDYFTPQNNEIYKTIYTQMVEYYYQETVDHIHEKQRKVTRENIQSFLKRLLDKCLENEKNFGELLETTFTVPLIFDGYIINKFSNKDKHLYDLLIDNTQFMNNIFNNLVKVDSSLIDLYGVFNEVVSLKFNSFTYRSYGEEIKDAKYNILWKGIILALIESSYSENNAFQEYGDFKSYFICYCLTHVGIGKNIIIQDNDPINNYVKEFDNTDIGIFHLKVKKLMESNSEKIYLGNNKEDIDKRFKTLAEYMDSILENEDYVLQDD